MLIGMKFDMLGLPRNDSQKDRDFLLDRFWIWLAKSLLERSAPLLLAKRHAAAAAAFTVGKAIEEMALLAGGDVIARGIVLAVLEALEAVERNGFVDRALRTVLLVKEQRMAAQASA